MEPKDFSLLEQAYRNVYAEGAEEYAGGQHPSQSPNKKDRDRYETQRRRNNAPKGVGVPDKSVGYGQLKQDVDVFELVKGHLMSEGYADNEKAALAIMANMSEGWRQSIVEDEQSSADAKERNRRTQDTLNRRQNPSDVVPPAPKLPPAPPEVTKPKDRSSGSAPAPRDRSTGNIPPRSTGGGSVKSIPPRSTGGGRVTGNTGSPGTIGTIQGGKPGDGYLGPTIRIGKTTIGIPNPNPVRRSGN